MSIERPPIKQEFQVIPGPVILPNVLRRIELRLVANSVKDLRPGTFSGQGLDNTTIIDSLVFGRRIDVWQQVGPNKRWHTIVDISQEDDFELPYIHATRETYLDSAIGSEYSQEFNAAPGSDNTLSLFSVYSTLRAACRMVSAGTEYAPTENIGFGQIGDDEYFGN